MTGKHDRRATGGVKPGREAPANYPIATEREKESTVTRPSDPTEHPPQNGRPSSAQVRSEKPSGRFASLPADEALAVVSQPSLGRSDRDSLDYNERWRKSGGGSASAATDIVVGEAGDLAQG